MIKEYNNNVSLNSKKRGWGRDRNGGDRGRHLSLFKKIIKYKTKQKAKWVDVYRLNHIQAVRDKTT